MDIVIPGATNLGLFTVAALALLVVPGPAVLYIVARSVEQGRLAGFVSDLGIHSATLVHVLAAALGLSALLASSALAFAVVKYAGAAYLIWIGLKKIFGRAESGERIAFEPLRLLAALPRRLRRQPAQPEDGAVLPGLPAAIRRGEPRPCGFADRLPRPVVHLPRLHQRRLLRTRRKCGRQLAEAQPRLPELRALCQRRDLHRARRIGSIHRQTGMTRHAAVGSRQPRRLCPDRRIPGYAASR